MFWKVFTLTVHRAEYHDFLQSKQLVSPLAGFEVEPDQVSPVLFPFQQAITRWALSKGRSAIFADTGLGKTLMQVEWARQVVDYHNGKPVLIVAPLSVARQTVRESERLLDVEIQYVRSQDAVETGIYITNYEMIDHFNADAFTGVVLDESSILKALDGKTRKRLTAMFRNVAYKLCCTATPAPNDIAELGNHAAFLGIMEHHEMLAAFFVHGDLPDQSRQGWRLKGHAVDNFYRWLASWGMAVRKPSDIGYSDEGYNLPALNIEPVFVPTEYVPEGQLLFTAIKGIQDRSAVRKATIDDRVTVARDMVLNSDDQWIIWHGLNDEGYALQEAIPGAVLVEGSQSPDEKAAAFERFQDGDIRVLVTKPKIGGFGMNFQNAHNMVFVGLSDSFEAYYQCIRRCYRFGQQEPVNAYIVLTDIEDAIYQNVQRKEREAMKMQHDLIEHVAVHERQELTSVSRGMAPYAEDEAVSDVYRVMMGDSVERINEVEDESVDLSVFSPPFLSLFTYSPSERDIGNCRDDEEFWMHFQPVIDGLMRITKPGRLCAVHCAQVPLTKNRDGVIGIKDFRGDIIRAFTASDWIYHGEVTVDKNPQVQAIRTKSKGLLFTQLKKDASWLRPAYADYIVVFRKPGENQAPIHPDISNEDWILWAHPVWYSIRESDTLNAREAREEKDERHVAPLQLETIERCIRLWSNEGETVFDPFTGIGSTGYVAIQHKRKFVGIELKPSYYQTAVRNLHRASNDQLPLFTALGEDVSFAVAE